MLSLLFGFIMRFLPDVFSFIGNILKGREEAKLEERKYVLQERLATLNAKMRRDEKVLDAELSEALAKIQSEMSEITDVIRDRKSAREYGLKAMGLLSSTLAQGKQLGVLQWVLSVGWFWTMLIEGWSAMIQPAIATCVLTMWAIWKGATFYAVLSSTGGVATAILACWQLEDWLFLEAVLGFFLAGRVMKWRESRNVGLSIGEGK